MINLSIVIFTSRRVFLFFSASVFVISCNTNKIAKSKTEKSEAAKPKLVKADETYVAFRNQMKKGTLSSTKKRWRSWMRLGLPQKTAQIGTQ